MEGRVALIDPADILFAEASDGHIYLQTTTERLATPFTMTELEQRLSRQGFFRAQSSYLVNLQHVGEIIPYTRSSFSLKLSDTSRTERSLDEDWPPSCATCSTTDPPRPPFGRASKSFILWAGSSG